MNKKIFFFSLIFIIILFIWKDYKKIDFHFVNKSKVTYNYKNLNNNFLKTIHRKYQKFIENFLIKYSNKHKLYWELEDENIRSSLPNFKYLENPSIVFIRCFICHRQSDQFSSETSRQ